MLTTIPTEKTDAQVMGQIVAVIAAALSPQTDIETDHEMIDLWLQSRKSELTRSEYRRDIEYFLAWMGGAELRQVSLKDMSNYQAACVGKGWKPATIRRKINAVRSLLRFAVKAGYLHSVPGEGLPLPADTAAPAVKVLSVPEIHQLIALSKGRDRVLIRLLYASGGRCAEICGLKWQHIQATADGTAIVTLFGKGAKTRAVVVSADTWRELLALRGDAAADAPVFPSRKGKGHLSRAQVYRIVVAAASSAGITGKVSPHWFRHSHATHAIDRKVPLQLIQATLGHASIATTQRYLHANPKDSSGLHLSV
jgi:integrase/recombinase XerD